MKKDHDDSCGRVWVYSYRWLNENFMLCWRYHNKNTGEKNFKYILLSLWNFYILCFDHIHFLFCPSPQKTLLKYTPPPFQVFLKKILPHSRYPGKIIWKFRITHTKVRKRVTETERYISTIQILNNQQFCFQHFDCVEAGARSRSTDLVGSHWAHAFEFLFRSL